MRERDMLMAKRLGIYDRVAKLEVALLAIDRVDDVEFDLNGFLDGINQIIIVPRYNIPAHLPNYFEVRDQVLKNILGVARSFDLYPSGDVIEDYGEHWYIVRSCGRGWYK